jgi:hypothetical protein
MSHGNGQKDARAAKRKYYLEEEVRNERLTEGGDFVLRGRSEPLHLSVPQARNFGIMFRCLFYSTTKRLTLSYLFIGDCIKGKIDRNVADLYFHMPLGNTMIP